MGRMRAAQTEEQQRVNTLLGAPAIQAGGSTARIQLLERTVSSLTAETMALAVAVETLHRSLWALGLQPEEWQAARRDIEEIRSKGDQAELVPLDQSAVAVRTRDFGLFGAQMAVRFNALVLMLTEKGIISPGDLDAAMKVAAEELQAQAQREAESAVEEARTDEAVPVASTE